MTSRIGSRVKDGLTSRFPLRVTLTVVVLVVVALGLFVSAFAVTTAMQARLLDRVDTQLYDATRMWAHKSSKVAEEVPPPSESLGVPNQRRPPSEFFIQRRTADGTVTFSLNDHASAPDLSGISATDSNRIQTVNSTDGSATQWRVLTSIDGNSQVVLALPLDVSVKATVRQLVFVQLAVGIVVLIVVGVAGVLIVRRSLKPLTEVSEASADLAAGNFSRRLPERPAGTEVGSLTSSFNEMATKVEAAFIEKEAAAISARHSEERMRRFVADASHELRTPLTSISGFSELTAGGAIPPEVALSRIDSEAKRMSRLVEDLLTLAKLDAERPLDRKPVDLATVAVECVQAVSPIAPEHEISLQINSAPQPLGDIDRIKQVVTNLLTNAVKHTPAGTSVLVTVDTEDVSKDNCAVLKVADDGQGMSAEDAKRVFERFTRLDDSRTRRSGGGAGLGLSIVHGIVTAHGGTIDLETAPGQGATFIVRLPQVLPEPGSEDPSS